MEDPLHSAIEKFFSKIRLEPKRIFHGRGQLFPEYSHVCMDWYPPVVFVSAYDPIENRVEVLSWLRGVDKLSQIKTVMLQKRYERNSAAEIYMERARRELLWKRMGLNSRSF